MSSISPVADHGIRDQNIFVDTARGIYDGACQAFKNIKQIQGDPATFGRALRIVGYVFAAIVPGSQEALKAKLSMTDNLTDSMQVLNSAHSLKNKQSIFEKLGHLTLMTSGTGAGVLFMDEMNIISLPTTASETGGFNVLASVTKSAFGKAVNVGLGIGYAFMGLDSALKLAEAQREVKSATTPLDHRIATMKRSTALLNLVWNVAEVALKVLIVTAVASTGFIVLAGVVAAGLGICSFLHSAHVNEEAKNILKLGDQ